jgi:hypothetical protein
MLRGFPAAALAKADSPRMSARANFKIAVFAIGK